MRKLNFTVVDDDAHVLFFVKNVLRKTFPKCHIAAFDDGVEALEHVKSSGADILITDHKMTHMNGAELIRNLRADRFTGPIIMISSSPNAKDEGLAAGATVYMEKDPSMVKLTEVVQKLIHL